MAKFTFGDASPDGNSGNAPSGDNSGQSGEGNGNTNTETGNTGTPDGNSGPERQAGVGSFGAAEPPPKKRRGRKPYPRDANGNIIRPDTSPDTGDKGTKERVDLKNDRVKVKANIAGLHAMAAVLTKQPILNLADNEATALTNSLCDVADYHNIDLIGAGGAFGLYASLATTAYMIYMPRIITIKHNNAADNAKPANPGEAAEQATRRTGTMDFSGDVSGNGSMH